MVKSNLKSMYAICVRYNNRKFNIWVFGLRTHTSQIIKMKSLNLISNGVLVIAGYKVVIST